MNQQLAHNSMVGRYSFARIARLGLGGAIGGLITFGLFFPILRSNALVGTGNAGEGWGGTFVRGYLAQGILLGAMIGMVIGASLVAAEEWYTGSGIRITQRAMFGAMVGAGCGALGGLDGQFVFTVFSPLSVVIARSAGWALMGAGAGLCPGAAGQSLKRAELGAFGGLVGGFCGGLLFDVLAMVTHTSDLGRAVGLVLVGAMIGIMVGLIEEVAKEHWVTVLTGAKEGQSYPITKPRTSLGRDETIDIPLFGDSTVEKLHAWISKSPSGARIVAATPTLPVLVNARQVTDVPLSDGDIISIGKHRLRFGTRRTSQPPSILEPVLQRIEQSVEAPVSQPQPEEPPTNKPTVLWVVAGPHSGRAYPISTGTLTIGRSPECEIALVNDGQVSRRHAQVAWNGACWRIEDCGSTNGVFVNSQRVSTRILNPGDQITVGQSVLRMS